MFAVLGTARDNKERVNRDFAIYHSLLERKFINDPKTSFCSIVKNPKEFSFIVIGETKDILDAVMEFSQKYFSSLTITPNVTIELVTSPNF